MVAGNIDVLFVVVFDIDVEVFVVECISFCLWGTWVFAPCVVMWFNLVLDYLDWYVFLMIIML